MKKILSIGIVACLLSSAQAQDVHFSQFYETNILRNPGMIGIFQGDFKLNAAYRNQWSSISAPFITGMFSFETKIPVSSELNDFFSIGLLAYYDKAGTIDMKTIAFYPAVSYSKSLEDAHNSFLSVGFAGGYVQRSFDPGKMTFNSQYQNGVYNPDNPSGEQINDPSLHHYDIGAGISFSSSAGENNDVTYYFGASGYHFLKPNRSFMGNSQVNLDMKWNLNAGFSYKLSEQYGLVMHGNYLVQGKYTEMIAGGLVSWKNSADARDYLFSIYAGAFYRINDALIPTIRMDYLKYSFGMSYDLNVSKLKAATNMRGGYELTVSKTGLFKDPKWEKSRTICPDFW